MLPPENDRLVAPAAGLKVGEPQPTVLAPVGLATLIWPGVVGKVSAKLTLLWERLALGLVMMNCKTDVPFAPIVSGRKALLIFGAAAITETLSVQVLFVSFDSATRLSGSIWQTPDPDGFVKAPDEAGVTGMETLNESPAPKTTDPEAVQVRVFAAIEQLIVPLVPTPLVNVGVP